MTTESVKTINVLVRVRPPQEDVESITNINNQSIQLTFEQLEKEVNKQFIFDKVFDSRHDDGTQEDLFDEIMPILQTSIENGINTCILAFGSTNSGKTYTVQGADQRPGLIPRIAKNLYDAENVSIRMSYVEIYNQKVYDLFTDDPHNIFHIKSRQQGFIASGASPNQSMIQNQQFKQTRANIRYNDLPPLSSIKQVSDQEKFWKDWNCSHKYTILDSPSMEQFIHNILFGMSRRTTAETEMNQYSSRSHAILTLFVQQQHKNGTYSRSEISIVDLAGSERLRFNHQYDKLSITETKAISLSLQNLGLVIRKIANKPDYVPFNNNILTRMLRNSLKQKIIFIATISPDKTQCNQSIQTLTYASQMKKFNNVLKFNIQSDPDMLQADKAEYEQMLKELEQFKLENEYLKGQIAKLIYSITSIDKDILNQNKEDVIEYILKQLNSMRFSDQGDDKIDSVKQRLFNQKQYLEQMVVKINNQEQSQFKLCYGDYLEFQSVDGKIQVDKHYLHPSEILDLHQNNKMYVNSNEEVQSRILLQIVSMLNKAYVIYYDKDNNNQQNVQVILDDTQIVLDDYCIINIDSMIETADMNSIVMLVKCMNTLDPRFQFSYDMSDEKILSQSTKQSTICKISLLQFILSNHYYIQNQKRVFTESNAIKYVQYDYKTNLQLPIYECDDESYFALDHSQKEVGKILIAEDGKLLTLTLEDKTYNLEYKFEIDNYKVYEDQLKTYCALTNGHITRIYQFINQRPKQQEQSAKIVEMSQEKDEKPIENRILDLDEKVNKKGKTKGCRRK